MKKNEAKNQEIIHTVIPGEWHFAWDTHDCPQRWRHWCYPRTSQGGSFKKATTEVYIDLNKEIKREHFQIPTKEEIIGKLQMQHASRN